MSVQIQEGDAPPRPLWKQGLFLGAVVAFLALRDWYNPGDAVIHLTDGGFFAGLSSADAVGDPGAAVRRRIDATAVSWRVHPRARPV